MSTSPSNLVNNLSEGVYNDKCTDLDYISIKDKKLIFRCFECKTNYEKRL